MKQTVTSQFLLLLAASCLGLSGAACGDDGASSNTPTKPTKKRRNTPAAAAPKPVAAGAGLTSYRKVDQELRHQFTEIDFISDPKGETSRDPFRSWMQAPEEDEDGPKEVDVCEKKGVRWGAKNFSVRDLNLIGLVKRGRSYAQFTDGSGSDSWIVRKGDCIGQEKAMIEEIGVGYVRLSITPPTPPSGAAPPPQKQNIPLYPDELEVPESIIGNFDED